MGTIKLNLKNVAIITGVAILGTMVVQKGLAMFGGTGIGSGGSW